MHDRQEDHAERNRDDEARHGEAQRLQRLRPIHANGDHADLKGDGKAHERRNAGADVIDIHADLMRAQKPAGFGSA